MNRSKFLKTCGYACLAVSGVSALLQSCVSSKSVTGIISGSDIVFPENDFEIIKNDQKKYRSYIIVHNDRLQYPICIFRHGENNFTAMLMSCTHQNAELQVFGDKLQCPAHGSEFDNTGRVLNAPADTNLRTFPVTVENNTIKISLK